MKYYKPKHLSHLNITSTFIHCSVFMHYALVNAMNVMQISLYLLSNYECVQ